MYNDIQKLFFKILLFFPVLVVVIAVNLIGDPARLFRNKDYEKGMARILKEGKNITDIKSPNFDDRALHKFYIQNDPEKKDVIVFGSSRAMLISGDTFPQYRLFNHCVAAAALEDYIAIYGLYREKKALPSIVILGIDPWIFNKKNGLYQWKTLQQEYEQMLKAMSSKYGNWKYKFTDFIPSRYLELVSLNYFQSSLHQIRKNFNKDQASSLEENTGYQITGQKLNLLETILSDGSRTWKQSERQKAKAEVYKTVLTSIAKAEGGFLFSFADLDTGLRGQFQDFISLLKKDNVRVVFFLAPYHPVSYEYYMRSPKYQVITKVEKYLQNLAMSENLLLVGSYNPQNLNIDDNSFSDDMHIKNSQEFKKLWKEIEI